jgi:hypothetical protein
MLWSVPEYKRGDLYTDWHKTRQEVRDNWAELIGVTIVSVLAFITLFLCSFL